MFIVQNLSESNSIVNQILKELRDVSIQQDRYRFRKNIERLGFIAAYEISKKLDYQNTKTKTPLALANTKELIKQPVVATILRAGIPLQTGVNQLFNQADLAYISAYRHHTDEKNFEIKVEYLACPDIENRTLILTDPMLATGQSLVLCYEQFIKHGTPKEVHLVSVIGSTQGVEYVSKHIPNSTLWIGCIDDDLNEQGYIVPGLGDAGDLSFGVKIQK
ncbi:MAG: uracil phosphoribosyltransferase [Flavobacteriales bacterium]|nr:uracil phosphoribosyltransferase [Flavobacteriales bacterium]